MKIKIQKESRNWEWVRETIFWTFFCILLAFASFEAGYIFRDFRTDDTRDRLLKAEERLRDHFGRITYLEGPLKRWEKK